MRARLATPDDVVAIARIYNQGIEDRSATFETRPRTPEDVRAWFDGTHPLVVVMEAGQIVAFASTSTYRPRACYAGIAEFSVYVARDFRGRGAGRRAMEALIQEAERAASGNSSRASFRRIQPASDCSARWAFARSAATRSTASWTGSGVTWSLWSGSSRRI